MSMEKAIRNFPQQFTYAPVVENAEKLRQRPHTVVCGMGGSNLTAGILRAWNPLMPVTTVRDYTLPPKTTLEGMRDSLFIMASYSGNTEETISCFHEAHDAGVAMAAFSVGGKLEELARKHDIPFIKIPDTGIQPRAALGYSVMATLKLMGDEDAMREMAALAQSLDTEKAEDIGKSLAKALKDHVPIFYASQKNLSLARIAKIKMNETGKIPSFYNAFPELNHNEMTGFDVAPPTKHLSEKCHFILFRDDDDHPQIKKRMDVVKKLYEDRAFPVAQIVLTGRTQAEKIFHALMIADWAAYYLGVGYGLDPENVPMVEEFKRRIAS